MKYQIDDWWASLTITEKERIASKIERREVRYPECTVIWNALTEERKQRIHDHVTDAHGHVMTEWKEGDTYSY